MGFSVANMVMQFQQSRANAAIAKNSALSQQIQHAREKTHLAEMAADNQIRRLNIEHEIALFSQEVSETLSSNRVAAAASNVSSSTGSVAQVQRFIKQRAEAERILQSASLGETDSVAGSLKRRSLITGIAERASAAGAGAQGAQYKLQRKLFAINGVGSLLQTASTFKY